MTKRGLALGVTYLAFVGAVLFVAQLVSAAVDSSGFRYQGLAVGKVVADTLFFIAVVLPVYALWLRAAIGKPAP